MKIFFESETSIFSWPLIRGALAGQRQALEDLVFFFREACEMKDLDLQVKVRKTPPNEPVVLDVVEVLALKGKLEGIQFVHSVHSVVPQLRLLPSPKYGFGHHKAEARLPHQKGQRLG